MTTLTAGRQDATTPILPTWRYWAGVLLVAPLVAAGLTWLLVTTGAVAALPIAGADAALWAAGVVALVVVGAAILAERNIRRMPGRERAIWLGVGLFLASAATAVAGFGAFFAVLVMACWGQGSDCLG